MSSTLTWLDHDAAARERSLRILALFRERDSRDELGIGSLRDALADQLFPGTSTIQTRLAYMLFVPWIYRSLETKRWYGDAFRNESERREAELVDPLVQQGDADGAVIYGAGVIGRLARSTLKRYPSSIYWAGLARWGILQFRGSQDQYFRSLEPIYRRREALRVELRGRRDRDDYAFAGRSHVDTWHPKLPELPTGFPRHASFVLRPGDASFLRDRILTSCGGTLLAWLVQHPHNINCDYAWLKPDIAGAPAPIRQLLNHARRFSLVIYGAALLYNLQLAQLLDHAERVDRYRALLDAWAEEASWAELSSWPLDEFFEGVRDSGHQIGGRTEAFVRGWTGLACRLRGHVADDVQARNLVRTREQSLKKERSRFTNRAALGQWGGAAGAGQIAYRWATVQTFVKDLSLVRGREDA